MGDHPRSLPEGQYDGEEWLSMLDSIDAKEIPIEMLKYLKAHMDNGTSFIFPIKEWIEQGADPEKINEAIEQWYDLKDDEIVNSDFVINLEKLQETVITHTNETLKDLK